MTAVKPPELDQRTGKKDCLAFVINGQHCFAPLAPIREIVSEVHWRELDYCADWLLGVFSHRTELYSLLDLSSMLGDSSDAATKESLRQAIILRQNSASPNNRLAVAIDYVIGLRHSNQFMASANNTESTNSNTTVRTEFNEKNGDLPWLKINFEALAEMAELKNPCPIQPFQQN